MSEWKPLNRHQFETYYHGTGTHNVASIMKHGLRSSNPAAGYEGLEEGETHEPGHPEGVYFSDRLEGAREYGDAIFSVELPRSADWGWSENGHVLKHGISPLILKRVE